MNKEILFGGIRVAGRFLLSAVMCMILSMSVLTLIDGFWGRFLCQILNLAIVISLSYVPLWNEGNNDVNKINYERMKRDPLRGLKYGLVAAVPGVIVYILLFLSAMGAMSEAFFMIYRFLNPVFLPLNMTLMPATLTMSEIGMMPVFFACFEMLLPVIVCGFAYPLGLHRYSLSERFIYPYAPERKKKKKKLRRY